MNVAELAAKLREAAARAEAGLAGEVVTEMVRDYLATLRMLTPKRTGDLMRSEYPDFIRAAGTHATAAAGPHIVYAKFRNDGGTITAKRPNKRGQLMLGTPAVGFFGKSVTQQGSHYMERAHDAAEGACHAAAQAAMDRFIASTGL